ncbi:DNA -binding domain-containing protein [Sphingobium baderi]|uniref:DNA -binding domain-containing protein n=1 Tax=Sphingobium baderi TaxID=1332080 RepID=UPI002FFC6B69
MVEIEPAVADLAPTADQLTPYDEARLRLYLRLLDAEAEGADWREVARIVLKRDPAREPGRSRLCWSTHLSRARWIAGRCFGEAISPGTRKSRRK